MQDATLSHTIDKRIFLAANLKDNEELMPHFILQLLLSVAAMQTDAVFISVYESGSTDLTGTQYLMILQLGRQEEGHLLLTTHYSQLTFLCPAAEYLHLLRALLQKMNVPHQIVTGELHH